MTNGINGTNGTNGTNGINGINGCFIPPCAQGRAKSPCVGADSISARKVRVIAGALALGGPYTQPYVGRRGEHCSPVAMGGGVKSLGSIWNAPLRIIARFSRGCRGGFYIRP